MVDGGLCCTSRKAFGSGLAVVARTVHTNSEGRVTFDFDTAVNTGDLVTATASILAGDPLRPGNTSEFSATRLVE